jgi:DNA-binding MarR family transcriptional regulator
MNSASIEALVRQLYGLGAIRRRLEAEALAGLGSQGFNALAVVHVQGPVRVSDVAEQLGVDLSVASRQVAALAAAGFVDRGTDARDRRAQLLRITASGDAALRTAHERMVAAFTEALSDWSDEDLDTLAGGLGRLRTSFAPALRKVA